MLVIFDCDGVLIDSERIMNQVLRECLAQLGLVLSLDETIHQFKGHSADACITIAEQLLGQPIDADALKAEYTALGRSRFKRDIKAIPGIVEVLEHLSHPRCVASNSGPNHVRTGLEQTGLMGYVTPHLFTAWDVPRPKPAPDLFLHAAQAMGFEPHDCIVVEDSPAGVTGAVAAGMRVLGYADLTPAAHLEQAGAITTFKSMHDLPPLLEW